jgi:hypothetical protein
LSGDEPMEMYVSAEPSFTADRLPYRTRFVLVNGRVPHTDEHCGLCGGIVENGYVRDSKTRLIYCDLQCFAGGSHMTKSLVKDRGRKVEENIDRRAAGQIDL